MWKCARFSPSENVKSIHFEKICHVERELQKYYLDESDKYRRTLETRRENKTTSKLTVGGQE